MRRPYGDCTAGGFAILRGISRIIRGIYGFIYGGSRFVRGISGFICGISRFIRVVSPSIRGISRFIRGVMRAFNQVGRRMRRPYGDCIAGVFAILCPFGRIIADILPDAAQRFIVANDVFVVIALPDS